MNYYYDTEFLEGTQKKLFGQSKPTIDLISIGIVCEDGREYYAISKDFNLKEAWNRYDIKIEQVSGDMRNRYPEGIKRKVYWIRENVLLPIVQEFCSCEDGFDYKTTKRIFNDYGKSNKQIAQEVKEFCTRDSLSIEKAKYYEVQHKPFNLYGYYSAYDHVALCWLFGKMIDLPNGFPMYCKDLKQILDDKVHSLNWLYLRDTWNNSRMSIFTIGKGQHQEKDRPATFDEKLKRLKELEEYPKQTNEHNALSDARWTKQLYEFLLKL